MKARIVPPAEERLLLYGMEEERQAAVSAAAASLGIRVQVVEPAQLGSPLGRLLGWEGFQEGAPVLPEEIPAVECLVIGPMERRRLDQLLRTLGQAGVTVALKAMVTPTNQKWPMVRLIQELRREHQAMTGETV